MDGRTDGKIKDAWVSLWVWMDGKWRSEWMVEGRVKGWMNV
jgi:hypothetical protein